MIVAVKSSSLPAQSPGPSQTSEPKPALSFQTKSGFSVTLKDANFITVQGSSADQYVALLEGKDKKTKLVTANLTRDPQVHSLLKVDSQTLKPILENRQEWDLEEIGVATKSDWVLDVKMDEETHGDIAWSDTEKRYVADRLDCIDIRGTHVGRLNLSGGWGTNFIEVQSVFETDELNIYTGEGCDWISLSNVSSLKFPARISMGRGSDQVSIWGGRFSDGIKIDTGEGEHQQVSIGSVECAGKIEITGAEKTKINGIRQVSKEDFEKETDRQRQNR